MWWRLNILGTVFILAVLVLSACGFSPVLSQNGQGSPLHLVLADVVAKDQTYAVAARKFAERLQARLAGGSNQTLSVELEVKQTPVGIEDDREVTRYNVQLIAHYTVRGADNAVLHQGVRRLSGSVEADSSSDFATFSAQEDTVRRLARNLADDLHRHLLSRANL